MAIEAQVYSENLGFALKGPQELFMENAWGFFDPQKRSILSDHEENLNYFPDNSSSQLLAKHSLKDQQSTPFSLNFSAHDIEKQRMEIDQLIRIQNERLRLALQEQRKQQTALIINKYESRTRLLLNQKEEQIAKASNITFQLENLLTRMEMENQTWQSVAKEKEATVASLNSAIQRLKETADPPPNGVDDAESCCQNIEGEKTETGEYLGNMRKMVCKCCNHQNSCVIILPCRHLCSCRDCEVFLYSCPVCRNVKKASIEVLI